jgi:TonB-linked SusC/RagA family outer membrane protein
MSSRHWTRLANLVALAMMAPMHVAQTQGTTSRITGRVIDQVTQQPIDQANVLVVGTTRGAATSPNGVYVITGVPAGTHQVRATRIGYQPLTRAVTVPPGGEVTADFALGVAATTLEQVVVTATGETQRIREQGASVARLEPPPERLAAVPTLTQTLAAQVPGVQVLASSGTAGTGARVRIRGANSLSLSNEPLIIVDGVRVTGGGNSLSFGTGGQAPSRLEDLNPEEIETFEILRGPAATGLYGTQAANGVIQITTKRGRAGRTVWNAWAEHGQSKDVSDFPANYGGWFTSASGAIGFRCDLDAVSLGLCTQDSVASFNPLKDPSTTPYRTGRRTQLGVSAAGGTERVTFFLSGERDQEDGVYRTNQVNRTSVRANVRAFLTNTLDATITTGYIDSRIQLPGNDNTFLGYVSNGLAGFARKDDPGSVDQDGYDPLGPASLDFFFNRQTTRRLITSLQGNWSPLSWLRLTGTTGLDLINRFDNQTIPPERILLDTDTQIGSRLANRFEVATYTSQLSATGTFNVRPALTSATTASFQYQREIAQGVRAFGRRLVAGTESLDGAIERFAVGEDNVENRLIGGILTQQFGWRDRLFLTAGARADDNSAFGKSFGLAVYPLAQVSWVASEEPFFPGVPFLNSLRLRGAVGQSGLRPDANDALTFFNPVASRRPGTEAAAVTLAGIGDATLRPERTTEYDVGADITALAERVSLGLNYYSKVSKDALVARIIPPSVGATRTRFENVGSVKNAGVEATLGLQALSLPRVQLDFTLVHSINKNKLVSLREDIDPILLGAQRHVPGYPLGAYWDRRITGFADTDGDGIVDQIDYSEEDEFLGSSIPEQLTSLQANLTLFRNARLGVLVDRRGGYMQFNSSEDFRCGITATCASVNLIDTPLAEQARGLASLRDGVFSGWVEDATFVRLREVTLTLMVPERFARRANARAMTLILAGHNLGIITDYSGVDPEVSFSGQTNFTQADFLTQAPLRRFSVRLNVSF